MKKRATVVISGDVQDVGFRGTVMRIAQKAGLIGYVENLPDGTVRAICEGEEKSIRGFLKKLEIRNDDISVEKVAVKWSKAQGRFKYFEVKYSDLGAEMFQGFATAGRKLSTMHTDLKGGFKETKEGLSDLKNEMKGGFNKVETAISSMHSDVNTRFDTLETRYGEIGHDIKTVKTDMAKLTAELHNSTEALISLTGKVGALIDRKLAE
ncbi:MAG: acylphosphatase [Euryarchaeota archaeon]|nr:acylphosphatase [Euryarchaeota archaeon]